MGVTDNPAGEALALEALLRWYDAMGVDAALDATPHNRFVAPSPQATAPSIVHAPSVSAASRPPGAAGLRPAETEAQALAAGAAGLADLQARWASVPGCTLAASSRMIPAHTPAGARLMLIGGAPGEDDERAGAIFAGKAGTLLDAMLRAIGLVRADVALTHVVPWRPPGNRMATPLELALCLPFCRRQIALAAPQVIVCLGERAAQPLLGTRDPLSRLRGRWLTYEGDTTTVKTLTSFSPSFLLGQPLHKRRAWSDLLMVEEAIAADAGTYGGRDQ